MTQAESSVGKERTRLVDSHTAARMLSISERKLWGLGMAGAIPRVMLGRSVRFSVAAIDDFIKRQVAEQWHP